MALDKSPGVRPLGIWETLHRSLDKLIKRAAGDQAKTACGNLQLCIGLNSGIEVATHAVGQQRFERVRRERNEEEAGSAEVEEESENFYGLLNNLTIETAVTEEDAAEGLKAILDM